MSNPDIASAYSLDPTNGIRIEPVTDPDAHPRLLRYVVEHADLGPDYAVGVSIALGSEALPGADIVAYMPSEPTADGPEPVKIETLMRGNNPNPKQAGIMAGIAAMSLWAFDSAPRGEEYRQRPEAL